MLNLCFKLLGFFIYYLPRKIQIFLGNLIGDLIYLLFPRAKVTGELNIAYALGDNYKRLIPKVFRHFGNCLIEFLQISYKLPQFIEYQNFEELKNRSDQKLGSIILSAHFGNWELVGTLAKKYNIAIFGLYREQRQAQDLILHLRSYTGMQPINVQKSLKLAIKALKEGNTLGIVGDQFIDSEFLFFKRKTSFPLGAAKLSTKLNVPIFITTCERVKQKLVVKVQKVIYPDLELENAEAIKKLVNQYIEVLESRILDNKEQYLWLRDFWQIYSQNYPKT